jgi:excisionase family DNA binding protein
MSELPELLYVTEVAAILRCSRWKVVDLINQGVLPAIRIGREFRIKRKTLEAWLDEHEEKAA